MPSPDPALFDVDSLRLDDDQADVAGRPKRAGEATALPRPRRGEPYLGGPIPMTWIEAAAVLPGKAWHLACALWFEALCSRKKSPHVQLSRRTRRRFGIERKAYYRALNALRGVGLVRTDRSAGQSATITILPVPKEGN